MSSSTRQVSDHQQVFIRQANILRKNLYEWNQMLRSSSGESWPSMLGRLNAAMVCSILNIYSESIVFLLIGVGTCFFITSTESNTQS